MMLRGSPESTRPQAGRRAVGAFRCVRPFLRYHRLAVQSLIVFALIVTVTLLVSHHHRHSRPTSSDPSSAAADILRRLARSVQEVNSDSGPMTIGDDGSNGYLVAVVNGSRLTDVEFRSYGVAVDLRLIVLAYDRSESLAACLGSLEAAEYGNEDRVALHVWIDGCPTDAKHDEEAHKKTIDVAQLFNFSHGTYHVHIRPQHIGVQGQWMTVWRPAQPAGDDGRDAAKPEIALILEDDISVSAYYWRWLRAAHRAYDHRSDVSGYSVSHPEMEHATGSVLEVPVNYTVFMYPIICTWGFSPHPVSWRQFENWFYEVDVNSSFVPLVDGILPTDWFVSERQAGRERTLWEQWHIYFTTARHQYTVLANAGPRAGLLAVNRHEKGLHDGNVVVGATQELCSDWTSRLDLLPRDIVKLGYDGLSLNRRDNNATASNV